MEEVSTAKARANVIQMVSDFDKQMSSPNPGLSFGLGIAAIMILALVIYTLDPRGTPTSPRPVDYADAGQVQANDSATVKLNSAAACTGLREAFCNKLLSCGQWVLSRPKIQISVVEDAKNSTNPPINEPIEPASINVSSSPSGAEVFLGEFDTGERTPLVDYKLDPGNYTLRLVGKDGLAATTDIVVDSGTSTNKDLLLKKSPMQRSPMERCLAELDDANFCVVSDANYPVADAVIACGQGIEMMSCEDSLPVGCWHL